MANKTEICNLALSWLGANLITDLEADAADGILEAKTCKVNYDLSLPAVIEEKDWDFCRANKDVSLSPTITNGFLKPPEAIRVLSIEEDKYDWYIEGDYIILEELTTINVVFSQVVPENKFTAMFTQALAARIATDIAIPLTKSNSLQDKMEKLYKYKLQIASTTNSLQGTREKTKANSLRNARVTSQPTGIPNA